MTKIKKLLIPTDFSVYSYRALNYAANIAKKTPAEITLLNVIPNPLYVYGYGNHEAASAAVIAEQSKYIDSLHKQSMRRLNFMKNSSILLIMDDVPFNHIFKLFKVFYELSFWGRFRI